MNGETLCYSLCIRFVYVEIILPYIMVLINMKYYKLNKVLFVLMTAPFKSKL